MNILKSSSIITLALISRISFPHDIASQLANAQKTKKQIQIEEQMSKKKANVAFNATSTILGLVLFVAGTQSIQNPSSFDLLQQGIGAALAGGGIYFGLHDAYDLLSLKKKLATYKTQQAS